MKRLFISLCSLLFLVSSCQSSSKTQPKKDQWINDQTDQTDTYAIPLDSSEEEEQQEQYELQQEQLRMQQKNELPQKNKPLPKCGTEGKCSADGKCSAN